MVIENIQDTLVLGHLTYKTHNGVAFHCILYHVNNKAGGLIIHGPGPRDLTVVVCTIHCLANN